MRHGVRLAVFLSIASMWVAARAGTAPPTAAVHARPATGGPAPLNDRQIEAAIRARFAKSTINEDHYQVRVQGGIAIIEGRTDVIQRKGTATRLARAAGAREVVNKVALSDAAKERAAQNLATGRRRAQVKRGDKRTETASR
jgi:BON domain